MDHAGGLLSRASMVPQANADGLQARFCPAIT